MFYEKHFEIHCQFRLSSSGFNRDKHSVGLKNSFNKSTCPNESKTDNGSTNRTNSEYVNGFPQFNRLNIFPSLTHPQDK